MSLAPQVPLYLPCDKDGLFPHDQFDVMLRVFGKDLGQKVRVSLTVAIAEDRLHLYPPEVRKRIEVVHPHVLFHVGGRINGEQRGSGWSVDVCNPSPP